MTSLLKNMLRHIKCIVTNLHAVSVISPSNYSYGQKCNTLLFVNKKNAYTCLYSDKNYTNFHTNNYHPVTSKKTINLKSKYDRETFSVNPILIREHLDLHNPYDYNKLSTSWLCRLNVNYENKVYYNTSCKNGIRYKYLTPDPFDLVDILYYTIDKRCVPIQDQNIPEFYIINPVHVDICVPSGIFVYDDFENDRFKKIYDNYAANPPTAEILKKLTAIETNKSLNRRSEIKLYDSLKNINEIETLNYLKKIRKDTCVN